MDLHPLRRHCLRLLACSIALAFATTASAQARTAVVSHATVDARTRDELLQARDAIWRSWFANDTAQLARLLPEAAVAGEGPAWEDRRAILDGARQFAASGGKLAALEFTDTDITVFGTVAVVRARFTYTTERAGARSTTKGLATEVFVRRDGRWLNPFWHLGGSE